MANIWNGIRAQLTQARVVPIVMSLVGSLVGVVVAYAAKHGLNIDQAQATAIAGVFTIGALGQALNWQQGNKQYEARDAQNAGVVEEYDVHPDDLIPDAEDLDSEGQKAAEAKLTKDK